MTVHDLFLFVCFLFSPLTYLGNQHDLDEEVVFFILQVSGKSVTRFSRWKPLSRPCSLFHLALYTDKPVAQARTTRFSVHRFYCCKDLMTSVRALVSTEDYATLPPMPLSCWARRLRINVAGGNWSNEAAGSRSASCDTWRRLLHPVLLIVTDETRILHSK